MEKRVHLELDLPEEVFIRLGEEAVTEKAKEALVMELLREHYISQGKAAEILGVTRHELFDLMTRYRVPVIDLTPEELGEELQKPFPNSSRS
ncbi:MAG: UPF0175 family protein [Chloroflexi bacterium]|nr:UPF0175 family protein [Chloroflexota bacterium]